MKRYSYILVGILLVCFNSIIEAQNLVPPLDTRGTSIIDLFSKLAASENDSSRIKVNNRIITEVESYVNSDSVFRINYKDARYLGQITSPDSMLKIVTWNLALENDKGVYYSYIIKKDNKGGKNRVYALSAPYSEQPVLTDTVYTSADWYGSLYYDIRPVISSGETCWIILGLRVGDPLVKRKIIDVISFTDNGSIIFGKKWFLKTALRHRVVFEYASKGTMTVRFTSNTSILFDHLVAVGPGPGNRTLFGSDYSYDSYIFTNGIWTFLQNIEARNIE